MKSKTPIIVPSVLLLLMAVFLTGFYAGRNSNEKMSSQIFRRSAARAIVDQWGEMDIYTSGNTNTFGTENMFTALTDVLPGQSVHPAHRHGEEEFLVITRGTGVWSLNGKPADARPGDLLYANPWDFHGLVNTGKDTLTFFVIKWKNKLLKTPDEPGGDHGK